MSRVEASLREMKVAVALVAILATLSVAPALALSPRIRQPSLYRIEAYLDEAPENAEVRDRIRISAVGRGERELLLTEYRAQGETDISARLSRRALGRRFIVRGFEKPVAELFALPAGEAFVAYLHAYLDAAPSLYVIELEHPVPAPGSSTD